MRMRPGGETAITRRFLPEYLPGGVPDYPGDNAPIQAPCGTAPLRTPRPRAPRTPARAGVDLRVGAAARAWLADAHEAGWGDRDYSAVLARILTRGGP